MGGFIKVDAKRVETTALNTKVDRNVFNDFKIYAKELGYPMNVILETFMRQYTNGRFSIDSKDIIKWKKDDYELDTLNTTFNKEIYVNFKRACKDNGYFVRCVIMAIMEKFASRNYILEYKNIEEIKREDEE